MGGQFVDDIVKNYGDLLFDLCESVLWNPINAQLAFRSILKNVTKDREKREFKDHERAWILRIASERLLKDSPYLGRKLTPSEQIELDAAKGVSYRLKQFDNYFHRLTSEDKLLLLLRDKYGIPYGEIAVAMGIPEGSLKIQRSHALRTLEDWIWPLAATAATPTPIPTSVTAAEAVTVLNCFEWRNLASDYLDGMLMGAAKTDADRHLDSCRDCQERLKRYRALLSTIASQPRSALPIPIRKSPLAAVLPRLDMATLSRSRWEQVPWYLRTSFEGAAIVLMILLGISAGPRIRALYERGVERSLNDFTQSLGAENAQDPALDPKVAAIPLARAKPAALPSGTVIADGDDFSSGGDDASASTATEDSEPDSGSAVVDKGSGIRVGSSQVWRFNLKTDSPHEIRPQVIKILTELHIPAETEGLGGVEAPGGIQFDLLVPSSVVPSLKRQLETLAPKAPAELADSPAGETFTWYMNKSKHKLPEHKTRVVIWLSQM